MVVQINLLYSIYFGPKTTKAVGVEYKHKNGLYTLLSTALINPTGLSNFAKGSLDKPLAKLNQRRLHGGLNKLLTK